MPYADKTVRLQYLKEYKHKIPLSRGGLNIYENLTIACRSCNCKKNNKTDKEYQKGKV